MTMTARVAGVVVLLALVTAACGGESTRLTLEEYVTEQQTMTDELQDMGLELAISLLEVVDLNAGTILDPAGLQSLLEGAVARLEGFHDRLLGLEPPEAVEDAHEAFVAAASDRIEQWREAAADSAQMESVAALETATDKQPAFFEACIGLEAAVADEGLELDLDCD